MPIRAAAISSLETDPPTRAPRIAGPPAIAPRPSSALHPRFLRSERRDDREALGRVVDREADDQRAAEGEFADRIGGADREAFAEVV